MKKILFFVMIVSFTTSLFAQTHYNDGFKNGYKEGYCHDKGVGCIPPNPPIAPTPQIGEDFNSYQDGYNRGFRMGTQANTSSNQTSGRKQSLDHDKPQFVDDFVYKPPYAAMNKALQRRQAVYDTNKELQTQLISWIYEMIEQTDDAQLKAALNERLRNYLDALTYLNWDYSQFNTASLREQFDYVAIEVNEHLERIKKENDPNRYWEIANKHLEKKEYQSAIDNYNKVIQLSPDFAPAYFQRGFSYANLNNSGGAMKDYSKYIQLEPKNPNGYYYRGVCKFNHLKDGTGALSDFSKVIELAPTFVSAYRDRAIIKSYMKDYLGALTDYTKVIELSSTPDPEVYFSRGFVKLELKDYYGAIKDYEEVIRLNPQYSMAYNNLGWSKFELKKYSEALVDVNKAIELDGKNATAYDSRAEIKFNLNDYKGCIEDCDKALSLNPQISNAYFIKGRATYRLGKKEKACEYWSKAGEIGEAEAFEYIAKYCNK